jgi:four helix bundle protein
VIAVIARHRRDRTRPNRFSPGGESGFRVRKIEAFGILRKDMNTERHLELRTRTKAFALRIIRMSQALPRTREANVINNQILRSATSMAANYRSAGRSRSKAEFVAKIGVVVEEADETIFWLELLADSGIVRPKKLEHIASEANQLLAIFSASRRTARE